MSPLSEGRVEVSDGRHYLNIADPAPKNEFGRVFRNATPKYPDSNLRKTFCVSGLSRMIGARTALKGATEGSNSIGFQVKA